MLVSSPPFETVIESCCCCNFSRTCKTLTFIVQVRNSWQKLNSMNGVYDVESTLQQTNKCKDSLPKRPFLLNDFHVDNTQFNCKLLLKSHLDLHTSLLCVLSYYIQWVLIAVWYYHLIPFYGWDYSVWNSNFELKENRSIELLIFAINLFV